MTSKIRLNDHRKHPGACYLSHDFYFGIFFVAIILSFNQAHTYIKQSNKSKAFCGPKSDFLCWFSNQIFLQRFIIHFLYAYIYIVVHTHAHTRIYICIFISKNFQSNHLKVKFQNETPNQ